MTVFTNSDYDDHESVLFFQDKETGLKAILAVHDTTMGPALGGTRMWNYATEEEALKDVLRLSRGMTYKSALAGLKLGGGKSVIIGDPHTQKSDALFEAFGRAVDRLNGAYIAAEDVGTSVADLEVARQSTKYIAGITEGGAGDPSPATSWGVFNGVTAAAKHKFGSSDLNGIKVAVQGLGNVGFGLCQYLHKAGAQLIVADIYEDSVKRAVKELGATAVDPETIHAAEVDIYAPCALGGAINEISIKDIKAPVIAGAANNQLETPEMGAELRRRGILYAPDYVINAGGIILISHEGPSFNREAAFKQVGDIHKTLLDIFARADAEDKPTDVIADQIALEILEKVRKKDSGAQKLSA